MVVKLLLSGDVAGNLPALSKRAGAVNKSNGPFDVLFCAGGFFAPTGPEEDEATKDYIAGAEAGFPVPLYFIGAFGSRLTVAFLDGTYNKAAFDAPGNSGNTTTCRHYTKADVDVLRAKLGDAGDVDIFLTNDWPEGVQGGIAPGQQPKIPSSHGSTMGVSSPVLAELLLEVRPRYHVTGSHGVFWARMPYQNRDIGAGAHVTRFISLAEVGNERKQKSLHALGLVPAKDMDLAKLHETPEGSTPCPYVTLAQQRTRKADETLDVQDWRYQQNKRQKTGGAEAWGQQDVIPDRRKTVFIRNLPFKATQQDVASFFAACGAITDIRRGLDSQDRLQGHALVQFESVEAAQRAIQMDGQEMMGRAQFIQPSDANQKDREPPPDCWFCLGSPAADQKLIISIGEEMYMAMDKGAISNTHVLLLPIDHVASTLELRPAQYAELDRFLSALREYFKSQGLVLVAFERFLRLTKSGGNHAHVNIIGVPARMGATAQQRFESMASQHGFSFKPVAAGLEGEGCRNGLKDMVGDGEFFSVLLPDGSRLLHPIPRSEKHPISFGREVLAHLLGEPTRADWKKCGLDSNKELEQTNHFRENFQRFDPMQQ
ncbi:hypothetical protein WJX84_000744 [Apatococcus fuscideae]|uniref:RRM domain-containing protein n=1 Tax=Apatococcus fuscideae TaxID=2026836 RepID=A0AAW1T377_9CHLO